MTFSYTWKWSLELQHAIFLLFSYPLAKLEWHSEIRYSLPLPSLGKTVFHNPISPLPKVKFICICQWRVSHKFLTAFDMVHIKGSLHFIRHFICCLLGP